MPNTYAVTRFFRDLDRRDVIATGLTLREARAHCQSPETSSSTCTTADAIQRTEEFGPWFDGYGQE